MESVLRLDSDLWKHYEDQRGEFLEDVLEQLLLSTFADAAIYHGSQFPDLKESAKDYENDFIVIVDTYAIVIEAKSGRVRPQSRRGALDSLKTNLNDLLVESSEQAQRFIKYLQANPTCHLNTKRGVLNKIDVTGVKTFIPLNITFELLGAISAYTPALRDAGLISGDVQLIPSFSFSNFEIIVEILEDSLQIIHYLSWRTELEKTVYFHADEVDLLAVYVRDGFMQAKMAGKQYPIHMHGESEVFNPYFMRHHHLQRVKPPRRRFTEFWRKLLLLIETEKPYRWMELAGVLLDFEYEKQKDFEIKARSGMRQVARETSKISHVRLTAYSGASVNAILRKDVDTERSQIVVDAFLEKLLAEGTDRPQAVLVLEASSKTLKDAIRIIYLHTSNE